jgi:hypothetical protein
VRQWVLSVPYPLRFLFANRPEVMGRVLGIVYRCIATHLTSCSLVRGSGPSGLAPAVEDCATRDRAS